MKLFASSLLIGAILAMSGCTEPDTYPVTGIECDPNDPVQDMDASECTAVSGI
ncbi:hypothetical protein [Marivita hallyeonensis]|uniref:Entry exclusion lipoprotein TrbK n=1 Tax=Marivita hallyeonensis TaxID=996342 RepID=A0A1M5R0H7_9RHOB|nr:hypothetical protein [Marivita hallyeonensis]SHH19904.1 hypothetical protein SAMN05443551_1575 [Marivita hallyeonensis]